MKVIIFFEKGVNPMPKKSISPEQNAADETLQKKRGRPRKQSIPAMETPEPRSSEVKPIPTELASVEPAPAELIAELIEPVEASPPSKMETQEPKRGQGRPKKLASEPTMTPDSPDSPVATSASKSKSEQNLPAKENPVVHDATIPEKYKFKPDNKPTAIAKPSVPSEAEPENEQVAGAQTVQEPEMEADPVQHTIDSEEPADLEPTLPDNFPKLEIDPEFEKLITPLTQQEFHNLRESIIAAQKVRDPIVVWGNIIVDGHNRYKICRETGIIPPISQIEFKNHDEAREWIIRNQFARRNLSLANKTYMIGKLYNKMKMDRTLNLRKGAKGHNVHSKKTSQKLAEYFKMEEKSVRRAGEYAQVLDRIQDEDIRMIILNRHGNIKLKEILNLRKLSDEDLQQAVASLKPDTENPEAILSGTVKIKRRRKPRISSPTQESERSPQVEIQSAEELIERDLHPELVKILPAFLAALKMDLERRYGNLDAFTCPTCNHSLAMTVSNIMLIESDPLKISNFRFKIVCNHCSHDVAAF